MKAHLVKVGNSRGIRIPKAVIDQIGLKDQVEIEVRGNQIVIRPAGHPRDGWEQAFKMMAEAGDDKLVDGPLPSLTSFDEDEWEW